MENCITDSHFLIIFTNNASGFFYHLSSKQGIWVLSVLDAHSSNVHTVREAETDWRRHTEWKSPTDVEWQLQNWA